MTERPASGDSNGGPLRFLDFELHLDSGRLLRAGAIVPLAPTPLRLLLHLAAQHGEVVSRQELREAVWDGRHVEFDEALNFAVRQLRLALGDAAAAPRVIETVPRRGYRFIAQLGAPSIHAPDTGARTTIRRIAAAAMIVVSIAAVLVLAAKPRRPSISLAFSAAEGAAPMELARFDSSLRAVATQARDWTVRQSGAAQLALTASVDSVNRDGSAVVTLDVRRPGAPAIIWSARVRAQPADWPGAGRDLLTDLARDLPMLSVRSAGSGEPRESIVEHGARPKEP